MATSDGKFLHGGLGKYIYRKYRGRQVIQERPNGEHFRLTEASKKSGSLFGIASNLAAAFRDNLWDTISGFQDGTMVSRFNKEVLYAVRQAHDPQTMTYKFTNDGLERLRGFEFNMDSPLRNYFFIQPQINIQDQLLKVTIPEFSMPQAIKLPKETNDFKVCISLAMYDLVHGKSKRETVKSVDVKNAFIQQKIESHQFDFELEPGCVCIVSVYLKYEQSTFSGSRSLNSKSCNPSAILKAFVADGEVADNLKWNEIPRFLLLGK